MCVCAFDLASRCRACLLQLNGDEKNAVHASSKTRLSQTDTQTLPYDSLWLNMTHYDSLSLIWLNMTHMTRMSHCDSYVSLWLVCLTMTLYDICTYIMIQSSGSFSIFIRLRSLREFPSCLWPWLKYTQKNYPTISSTSELAWVKDTIEDWYVFLREHIALGHIQDTTFSFICVFFAQRVRKNSTTIKWKVTKSSLE